MSAVYLIEFLPVQLLKVIEGFLIAYNEERHTCFDLVLNRNINGLKWLARYRPNMNALTAIDYASSIGNLNMVAFLHNNFINICTVNAMDWAAENGHLEVVKFLHENRTEGCTENAMNSAALNGHLDVVRILPQQMDI